MHAPGCESLFSAQPTAYQMSFVAHAGQINAMSGKLTVTHHHAAHQNVAHILWMLRGLAVQVFVQLQHIHPCNRKARSHCGSMNRDAPEQSVRIVRWRSLYLALPCTGQPSQYPRRSTCPRQTGSPAKAHEHISRSQITRNWRVRARLSSR